MKATAIIQNVTDEFFAGGNGITGLNALPDLDKFKYLCRKSQEGALKIKIKIGNDSFRDKVDLNQLLRNPDVTATYKIELRRGYRLAVFEIR